MLRTGEKKMFASEFTLIQSPKENNVVLTYLKYGQINRERKKANKKYGYFN